ncbi:cold-inducible protein YdjO-related protein [Paenibacillus turpanensis]|uniref:cold-inducible protein YdjO-related protein n=1 Tax=Paenibacillus turpanensis TaxID=2689078 RepID=UPI001408113E|nr:cold-inducible protein YdjO-related protein [Paenibacillus turpanensis]
MDIETVKPEVSPVPIWRCRSSECKAWMREELVEESTPACPICKGNMMRSMKHLPKLAKKLKPKKKQQNDTPLLH